MKNLLMGLLTVVSASAFANSELNSPNGASLPPALMVRIDAKGNREVFKMDSSVEVNDDIAAAVTVQKYATEANKIQYTETSATSSSELNNTSSTGAWFCGGWGRGGGWGGGWGRGFGYGLGSIYYGGYYGCGAGYGYGWGGYGYPYGGCNYYYYYPQYGWGW